jgi:uncharacterized membrane protein YccC
MAKKDKGSSKETEAQDGIRLTRHPRARRHIAMAKGWGGLGAFVVVLYLSRKAGLPLADAVLRGLLGGVLGYVVAWMIAVTVWRQLALAELERLRARLVASMEAQAAEAAAATGARVARQGDDRALVPAAGE